jgi:hypothetical protein
MRKLNVVSEAVRDCDWLIGEMNAQFQNSQFKECCSAEVFIEHSICGNKDYGTRIGRCLLWALVMMQVV